MGLSIVSPTLEATAHGHEHIAKLLAAHTLRDGESSRRSTEVVTEGGGGSSGSGRVSGIGE